MPTAITHPPLQQFDHMDQIEPSTLLAIDDSLSTPLVIPTTTSSSSSSSSVSTSILETTRAIMTTIPTLPTMQHCPNLPKLSFTQGVIFGQFTILLLVAIFLKYIIFQQPPSSSSTSTTTTPLTSTKRSMRTKKRSLLRSHSFPSPSTTTSSILNTLAYDLSSHPPESLDWLNVLIAQTITSYRSSILSKGGGSKAFFEKILNRSSTNSSMENAHEQGEKGLISVDWIKVQEVKIGEGFPVLSRATVRPSTSEGRIRVELDLDYQDSLSISISTLILFNFPRPRFALLPISLSLTLEKFSGTLNIELPDHHSSIGRHDSKPKPSAHSNSTSTSDDSTQSIHISLQPDFELNLRTSSLIGAKAKLNDLPKIEQLIKERLRSVLNEKFVAPSRVEIKLPRIDFDSLNNQVRDLEQESQDQVEDEQEDEREEEFEPLPTSFISRESESSSDQERISSSSTVSTTEIDLSNPKGPIINLKPKFETKLSFANLSKVPSEIDRNEKFATRKNDVGPGRGRSASPTESLPGFYRSFTGELNGATIDRAGARRRTTTTKNNVAR